MRSFVLVVCFGLSIASPVEYYDYSTEWVVNPEGDMQPFLVNLNSFNPVQDVVFQLYTKHNPSTYTSVIPYQDSTLGYFNVRNPTRLVIHGWLSSAEKMSSIKDAYLSVGDYNVILVDWSNKAKNPLYSSAKKSVADVGPYVAMLLDYLASKGVNLSNVHIAGHSLGAHIAGIAGHSVTSGKLGKITGMDPALPLFSSESLEKRLDKNDANFVEIIHTCGGLLAFSDSLGHVDFYPNDGRPIQPGCGLDLGGTCSHSRSHDYFRESIVTKVGFYGRQCSSWKDYTTGKCSVNPEAVMGEYTNPGTRGVFYLETARSSPYAKGP